MKYTRVQTILHFKPLRYLFAGGTGLVVNLLTLFILVSELRVWYVLGTVIAFILSSCVSFLMQKLLTFSNKDIRRAHVQLGIFFCVALLNLAVNTFSMYVLVSIFSIQYLMSQVLVNALIAIYSFFLYKYLVFRTGDQMLQSP